MADARLMTLVEIGRELHAHACQSEEALTPERVLSMYTFAVRNITGIHYDDMGDHVGCCEWRPRGHLFYQPGEADGPDA